MLAVVFAGVLVVLGRVGSVSDPSPADFERLSREASAALATDPAKATSLYRQTVELRPDWAEGWFYLGAALYQTGRYSDSRQAFQKSAALAPGKGAVWAFLGLSEKRLGHDEAALANIKRGESLGLPDDTKFISTVHREGAGIYMRRADFTSAVEQLQPLAKIGDDSVETIRAMGVCVLGLPYTGSAIPETKSPLIELAGRVEWALAVDHQSDAATLLEKLTTEFPREPGVHYLRGLSLLSTDPAAARVEFEKELEINPASNAAQVQLAILDIHDNRTQEAAGLARKVLAKEPENALAHTILARACMDLHEFPAALTELKTAAKLAPENPQIHLYLLQIYRQLGQTEQAEKELAEFKRLRAEKGTTN